MQSIIADLEHASHSLHSHTTAQKNAYWNSAAAKYFGTTAARSYTIYARANKRGAKPEPRHAELAVNLAGSMASFLIATWEATRLSRT